MYNQLTSEQRYYIEVSLQNGISKKMIAESLKVHLSTVYREISRNKGVHSYHHKLAQQKCDQRKHRMRGIRTFTLEMRKRIFTLLVDEQWSPEQIKGYLERKGESCVSVETIYSYIRFDRSVGGTLWMHCRHALKHVRRQVSGRYTAIRDRKMIDLRPAQADGKRFGDWEMDLVVDSRQRALLTLTEMSTNLMLIEKLEHGKKAMNVAKAVCRLLFPFREHVLSITTDNGSEFAAHQYITRKLKAQVFFTDAYSSWQKGRIENGNKLIRFYLPKETDFKRVSDKLVKKIQKELNARPRKKLNFSTPLREFYKHFS